MISVQNLTKTYADNKALDNVNFEVRDGEVLGFLGPNGAGKSTTMKIITGFIAPTKGTVNVDGLDVVDKSFEIREKIGYLPESNPLYTEMKVHEYLRFISEVRRIEKPDRAKAIQRMVDVCGLKDVIGKSIEALSKGYKQRVGLAQAMMHDPDILIMDEPTSGLDPNQIVEIRDLIKKIGEKKTVILSTHILPEVTATCSRVVIINQGNIVAQGTSDELTSGAGQEVVYIKVRADREQVRQVFSEYGQVKSVKEFSNEGDGVYSFGIEVTEGDGRELVFKTSVSNSWTLLELYRKQENLEDVFRRLTTTEE
jgi:ABC-2 type transport system ATP-binding protein